ncbi:diaminopimelate decarboxylase [Ruminococcaceae bacterium FB2012]|nr:diaminopimelate decarboxylase [Ruminococcaceae bacterium FB2012]
MDRNLELMLKEQKTAFYIFDSAVLKKRIMHLRTRLPERLELCYAVKANPFITKEIENETERFEICSPGEYEICKALGIDSRKMVISGIYKTPEVIEGLVSDKDFCGIFTAESVRQYRLLCELSEKYGRKLKVLPRLTNDSQFGIDPEELENIIRERDSHPMIEIIGVQFFSGTQKTSLKKFRRELEMLDSFLEKLKSEFSFEAGELEYGTGFPVSYFRNESLDEDALLEGFSELINGLGFKGRIILEIGRSIAASCGKYYTHIVDIKSNKGINYALIDGGMHHLVYYGQQMAMKQPFLSVIGKDSIIPDKLWTVCGSLCSMNDIVVKQLPLPEIEVGDVLCFENAGAYCMTEGISLLLSRDLPAVYIIKENGELYRVRRTFETLALNMPKYERMD